MNKSVQFFPTNYAEPVIEVVRTIVAADRMGGMKTVASLEIRAPEMQETPRRLRKLFERDRIGFIGADQLDRFLLLGALVMRRIAQRHRELADRAEAHADQFESKRKQLSGNGGAGWVGYDGTKQRRAA